MLFPGHLICVLQVLMETRKSTTLDRPARSYFCVQFKPIRPNSIIDRHDIESITNNSRDYDLVIMLAFLQRVFFNEHMLVTKFAENSIIPQDIARMPNSSFLTDYGMQVE